MHSRFSYIILDTILCSPFFIIKSTIISTHVKMYIFKSITHVMLIYRQAMTFSIYFIIWCLRKLIIALLKKDYLKYNIFLYHLK